MSQELGAKIAALVTLGASFAGNCWQYIQQGGAQFTYVNAGSFIDTCPDFTVSAVVTCTSVGLLGGGVLGVLFGIRVAAAAVRGQARDTGFTHQQNIAVGIVPSHQSQGHGAAVPNLGRASSSLALSDDLVFVSGADL